jgi:DNA helicase-2/ATP-dependent DNA helicase PcrA
MRVLAPAGSGKTKTLVNRICNLVNEGVDVETILPLAFNKKAAAEMNIRLEQKRIGCVRARTFHSLGYEIVRRGSRLVFSPETESRQMRELLREAFQAIDPVLSLNDDEFFRSAGATLSRAKMDLLPPERMALSLNGSALSFAPVFNRFLELQETRGFMNFDDMIYFAVKILIDNDALRKEYQEGCKYILVDEFQDLNQAQILLLQLLALPENNLFVVGDDDQLIYGWRGACVRSIIDFPRLHPCARECVLSTNYRSSSRIIAHAGWLILRNKERVPKSVLPREGAPPGGFDIELRAGLWEQAQAAAEWIKRRDDAGLWGENAVLFRYNALQFAMAIALDRIDIPHTAVDPGRLFDSRAGRDVAAWLIVVISPGSAAKKDIERILRRPAKVIRKGLIDQLESWHDVETLTGTGAMTREEEESLEEILCRIRTLRLSASKTPAHKFIEELDRTIHLRMFYGRAGCAPSEPDEADDRTYLDVIETVSRGFPTCEGFLAHIEARRVAPPVPVPERPPERDEVVLSTIHRAKGREFSRVVFFDLSRRHRPRPREIEEERRVTYVGLTRAKDALFVTADGRRQSPFLREAALDPQFAGRMREDLESELSGLRKRLRRLMRAGEDGPAPKRVRILTEIDALEEELRCRAMTSVAAPPARETP